MNHKQSDTIPSQWAKELFRNHVQFLGTHRGQVSTERDAVTVVSPRPEFTFAVLNETVSPDGLEDIAGRFLTIYLAPWSAPVKDQLVAKGFVAKGTLSYMSLTIGDALWPEGVDLEIQCVETSSDMETFSEVQCRGFLEREEDYQNWKPFLRGANMRNVGNPRQVFYIGSLAQRPAGVTLVVLDERTAGIYAVTTLPNERKRGVSSALLYRAVHDAAAKGYETVTLQVAQGSAAERLYLSLGFKVVFTTAILSRSN